MAFEGTAVLSYHDTLLRNSDIALLADGQWLNDNIISFWFEYLENELYRDVASQITFLTPQVAHLIKSATEHRSLAQDVEMILESMNLSCKKLVLLPINNQSTSAMQIGGSHWSLLVFDLDKHCFNHFDSSSGSGNRHHAEQVANIVKPFTSLTQELKVSVLETPCSQQKNGYDCGVHVLLNAEAVCRRAFRGEELQVADIASLGAVGTTRKRLLNLIEELKSKA